MRNVLDDPNTSTKSALVLLATKGEFGTIDSVLQEVSESFSQLTKFGWRFNLLIVDDGTDESFLQLCNERHKMTIKNSKVLIFIIFI